MKKLLFLFAIGTFHFSQAQKTVDVNSISSTTNGINQANFFTAGGVPFVNTKYVNLVQGSPYLTEQWMVGRVLGADGKKFFGNQVRLDIMNDQIHFKSEDGGEMVSTVKAVEMWLVDSLRGRKYHLVNTAAMPATHKIEDINWIQLMDTGSGRLFKVYKKMLSESLPYGTSVHEQRISTVEQYYIETPDGLKQVKKPRDLLKYLTHNKQELENLIKKQESEKRSVEEGFLQVIRNYNALPSK